MSKYDVWHLLHKLNSKELENIDKTGLKDPYAPLPENVVTDGSGNLYKIPDIGQTPLVQLENDDYFKYRYNWETKEIEVYTRDLDSENTDVDSYKFLESVGISPYDFIDNPEYWYRTTAETIEEDTGIDLRDFELQESYELYGEIIDDDKDNYKYEMKLQVELEPKDPEDYSDNTQMQSYENDYSNYVENFSRVVELYGEKVKIDLEYDSFSGEIVVTFSFPMSLTKDDIMELYNNEVESYLTGFSDNESYTITNIEIESLMEV